MNIKIETRADPIWDDKTRIVVRIDAKPPRFYYSRTISGSSEREVAWAETIGWINQELEKARL